MALKFSNIITIIMSKANPKTDSQTKCQHTNTIDQMMPEGCIHYSKKLCADCNAFITWNKSPKTLEDKENRTNLINSLKKLNLSSFERSFVTSIDSLMHLTPKQDEVYKKICNKYNLII